MSPATQWAACSTRRGEAEPASSAPNESQLLGVDTLKRDMTASALLLDGIAPGFEDGSFRPPVIARSVGLEDAASAYRSVAAGTRGRVVIAPRLA